MFDRYKLSKNQKRIVLSGVAGKEFSRNDITKAMNNTDRDTYDQEVTGLRNTKLLEQTLDQTRTKNYAYRERIDKNDVPRFKVIIPTS